MQGLLKISQRQDRPLEEFLDFALQEVLAISDSELGFMGHYSEERRVLTMHAFSKAAMQVCRISDPPSSFTLDETSLWGEAIRRRGPVIINDYLAPDQPRKGCPAGHAPLFRFLAVPAFSEGRIVALKPEPADGARTALAQAQQALAAGRPFPLAIVDPDLADLDGGDVIHGLRQHQRRRAAAIVLVSGEHHQGQVKRRHPATRVQSLTKPVSQEELLQAIVRGLGLAAAPGPRQAARGDSLRTPRPLRILLAEDTAAGRLFATDVLTERGHVVQTVEDGREAVELVRDQGFDLILMDVQMPALDGFQTTAAIRSLPDPAKSGVPIVAITAHAVQGYEASCLAAGMNGYLSKPLRSQTLIETVERLAVQPGSDPPASLGSRSNPAPELGLQTVPPSRSTLPT